MVKGIPSESLAVTGHMPFGETGLCGILVTWKEGPEDPAVLERSGTQDKAHAEPAGATSNLRALLLLPEAT